MSGLDPVVAAVQTQLEARSIPAHFADQIFAAIDAAGYNLVTQAVGTPVTTIGSVQQETLRVEGAIGVQVRAVKLPTRGWVTWVEITDPKTGVRTASAPSLLLASKDLAAGVVADQQPNIGRTNTVL